jgi:hypothetical protein
MLSVSVMVAVCEGVDASDTRNVRGVLLAVTVGVPLISPDGSSERPFGSCPAIKDHFSGTIPPVAVRFCEYGRPTWPSGSEVVTTTGGPGVPTITVAVESGINGSAVACIRVEP